MFDLLLRASIQGGVLIAILFVALKLIPAIPPKVRVWLWRIVFLKLAFSLLPIGAISLNVLPAQQQQVVEVATSDDLSSSPLGDVPSKSSSSAWLWAWAAGITVASILMIRRMAIVNATISEAQPGGHTISCEAEELAIAARLRSTPDVLISRDAPTALAVGLRDPLILLPDEMRESEDRRLVLAHETSHIAHRDLQWNVLLSGVRIVFFFHPLVWLAARAANQAQEAAADAAAIRLCNATPKRYGEMLLRATLFSPSAFPSFSTGLPLGGSTVNIRQRLHDLSFVNAKLSLPRIAAITVLSAAVAAMTPAYQLGVRTVEGHALVAQTSHTEPHKASHKKHSTRHTAKRSSGRIHVARNSHNGEIYEVYVTQEGKTTPVKYRVTRASSGRGVSAGNGESYGVGEARGLVPSGVTVVSAQGVEPINGVASTVAPQEARVESGAVNVTSVGVGESAAPRAAAVAVGVPAAPAMTATAIPRVATVAVRGQAVTAPAAPRVVSVKGLVAVPSAPQAAVVSRNGEVISVTSAPSLRAVKGQAIAVPASPRTITTNGEAISVSTAPSVAVGASTAPPPHIAIATSAVSGVSVNTVAAPAIAVSGVPTPPTISVSTRVANGVKVRTIRSTRSKSRSKSRSSSHNSSNSKPK